MTLDDLTVNFGHLDREKLLSDWRWMVGSQKHTVLITLTGNQFVQDELTGAVEFLDVGSPELFQIAESGAEFRSQLEDRAFVYRMFDVALVADLLKSGPAGSGKLFGFKLIPKLGGTYEVSNFERTDLEVHFSLCGQLQQQLASVRVGTQIERAVLGEG